MSFHHSAATTVIPALVSADASGACGACPSSLLPPTLLSVYLLFICHDAQQYYQRTTVAQQPPPPNRPEANVSIALEAPLSGPSVVIDRPGRERRMCHIYLIKRVWGTGRVRLRPGTCSETGPVSQGINSAANKAHPWPTLSSLSHCSPPKTSRFQSEQHNRFDVFSNRIKRFSLETFIEK
jgi:hypothetical protein